MEVLRHRDFKLKLLGIHNPQLSVEQAAELCVSLGEEEDPKYKGPHRDERVQFWKEVIEAKRTGTITFIPDGQNKTDGLCEVCDHPNRPKCFGKNSS